jgi:hypothetical protein
VGDACEKLTRANALAPADFEVLIFVYSSILGSVIYDSGSFPE